MKKLGKHAAQAVGILIVGAAAFMFLTGRWDWNEAKVQSKRLAHEGAGAVAGLGGSAVVKRDPKVAAECRENLMTIERAKRRAAQEKHGGVAGGTVSAEEVAAANGGKLPECPAGGTYSIGPLNTLPRCSIYDNGTQDREDDHFIRNF